MKIIWTKQAKKDLEKLETDLTDRIIGKIEDAADFPAHYLSPMTGYDLHNIRVGNYRAIIKKEEDRMAIITVGHRKHVYRHF